MSFTPKMTELLRLCRIHQYWCQLGSL